MSDQSVWKNRQQTINDLIISTIKLAQNGNADRAETISTLLTCLKDFGASQFQFFYEGFYEEKGAILEPSYRYPPEYVLRTLLDQIAVDLTIVRRALNQRNHKLSDDKEREGLRTADILAYRALKPAIDTKILPHATVITYFQKAANTRIIPYAPILLIGVPYSAIANSRDFLATAHEVGHYIFRYGQGASGRFRTVLEQRVEALGFPQWSHGWLEETFADVYGTLIGGPIVGWGMQDLLNDNSLKQFMQDDGEHPLQPLRPHIHTHTLRAMGLEKAADALDKAWAKMLARRGKLHAFTPANGSENITLEEANKTLLALTDLILTVLEPLQPNEIGPHHLWTRDLGSADAAVDTLYQKFETYLQGIADNMAAEIPQLQTNEAGTQIKTKGVERPLGSTGLWIDEVKKAHAAGSHFRMPPTSWITLRSAGGWSDLPGNGDGIIKGAE